MALTDEEKHDLQAVISKHANSFVTGDDVLLTIPILDIFKMRAKVLEVKPHSRNPFLVQTESRGAHQVSARLLEHAGEVETVAKGLLTMSIEGGMFYIKLGEHDFRYSSDPRRWGTLSKKSPDSDVYLFLVKRASLEDAIKHIVRYYSSH